MHEDGACAGKDDAEASDLMNDILAQVMPLQCLSGHH